MDFRRKFEFGLGWRTLLLVAAVWLFNKSLATPDLRAGRVVAALVAAAALASNRGIGNRRRIMEGLQ